MLNCNRSILQLLNIFSHATIKYIIRFRRDEYTYRKRDYGEGEEMFEGKYYEDDICFLCTENGNIQDSRESSKCQGKLG